MWSRTPCNPIELTRREWENVAEAHEVEFVNVEIICSDTDEHRRRVEGRTSSIENLLLPTWREVTEREYHVWDRPRIVIDTAGTTPAAAFEMLRQQLANR